jgi:hypothetical protein
MAWKRADDLSGTTDDVEQRTFGLDGKAYVIDLGQESHQRLVTALEEFVRSAVPYGELPVPPDRDAPPAAPATPAAPSTRVGQSGGRGRGKVVEVTAQGASVVATTRRRQRRTRRPPTNPPQATVTTQTIREWARANGFEVQDTGRIRGEVLEAFNAAH